MNVVVYTIALNEEQNAEQFMKCCEPAELIVVGDTGSTDRTREIIQDYGGKVVPLQVRPWRFDVPRNAILSLLPDNVDFCLPLDLDEVLCDGWRDILEENWDSRIHHRLRFRYVHNFTEDGAPGTTGMKAFGHARFGYVWRHAVHEDIYYVGEGTECTLQLTDFVVEHRQLPKKDRRTMYTELLEQECNSPTSTPRHVFWLAREYIYLEDWPNAEKWCNEFLKYPDTWNVERAHALRYRAKAEANQGRGDEALVTHYESLREAPEREMWLDLAWYHYCRQEYLEALMAAQRCLRITERPAHYLTTPEAWGYAPYEVAAICLARLDMKERARKMLRDGVTAVPIAEERLLATGQNLGLE